MKYKLYNFIFLYKLKKSRLMTKGHFMTCFFPSNSIGIDGEIFEDLDFHDEAGLDNVWGGIPAKNHRGENLLIFIGIIDILQEYGVAKKVEHYWKSLIHDGDTVS